MPLPYYSLTGRPRESDLVKFDVNPDYTREPYTLQAGSGAARSVTIGTILAMSIAAGAISVASAAVAGGTGNGTLTLAGTPFLTGVQEGVYTVICTTAGADGTSKFRVEDPSGKAVGTATGGTAFAKQIAFTIAGGGTNFAVDDMFRVTVTVAEDNAGNKAVAWVPGAADWTGRIWGVSVRETTAPDGVDADGLALRRGPAILSAAGIQWPAGISAANKQAALDVFEQRGFVLR